MQQIISEQPQQVKCPYCSNNTISTVTFKNGYISYLTCLLALLLFGLMLSFLFIPIIMLMTKTLIHRCSVCNEEIGGDGKVFHAVGIKDTIVSFKLGELGFIVTKRVVIGISVFVLTMAVLAYRINNIPLEKWSGYHQHNEPSIYFNFQIFLNTKVTYVNDTWMEYLEVCSREKIYTTRDAHQQCQSKYVDKTISNWTGYAIRIEDYQQSLMKYIHHAVTILVRMEPQESEFHPDLLLTADSETAEKLTKQIELLDRGSEFMFSATIKSVGDSQTNRHFHLVQLEKQNGYIEIPPHLHQNTRYGNEPQFLNGN